MVGQGEALSLLLSALSALLSGQALHLAAEPSAAACASLGFASLGECGRDGELSQTSQFSTDIASTWSKSLHLLEVNPRAVHEAGR